MPANNPRRLCRTMPLVMVQRVQPRPFRVWATAAAPVYCHLPLRPCHAVPARLNRLALPDTVPAQVDAVGLRCASCWPYLGVTLAGWFRLTRGGVVRHLCLEAGRPLRAARAVALSTRRAECSEPVVLSLFLREKGRPASNLGRPCTFHTDLGSRYVMFLRQ